MKKYDELLKRVEVFEKLAIYGNRRSFLKAIAQDAFSGPAADEVWNRSKTPTVGVPEDDGLDSVEENEPRKEIWDPAKQTWTATTASNDELTKLPAGTVVRVYMDNVWKFFKNNGPQGWAETTKPGATVIPFRSDVFRAQQRMTQSPYSFKDLEVDGKLGPLTRAYLKSYRQQVSAPADQSDEQSIAALNTEPFNEPAAPLPAPQGVPVTTHPKLPVTEPPF